MVAYSVVRTAAKTGEQKAVEMVGWMVDSTDTLMAVPSVEKTVEDTAE